MATAALPSRTAFATCIGCETVKTVDHDTRLCIRCASLTARTEAYCSRCGLARDETHLFRGCDHRSTVGYCERDGWWLGTHPRCPA